jgi:hypothetical protein
VVHSGDTFGAVVAVNVANNPCAPTDTSYTSDLPFCLGGVARRAALIAQLRNDSAHALVVDTGNSLPGMPPPPPAPRRFSPVEVFVFVVRLRCFVAFVLYGRFRWVVKRSYLILPSFLCGLQEPTTSSSARSW